MSSRVGFPGAPMSISPPSPIFATEGFISSSSELLEKSNDVSIFDEIAEFSTETGSVDQEV